MLGYLVASWASLVLGSGAVSELAGLAGCSASVAAANLALAFFESCFFLGGNGFPDSNLLTRAATVSVG
jgi:hypothetical protein